MSPDPKGAVRALPNIGLGTGAIGDTSLTLNNKGRETTLLPAFRYGTPECVSDTLGSF